jgi:hypothetical protein
LVSFIIKYKILTENQYGLKEKKKSTNSACQSFIVNAQEALDRQLYIHWSLKSIWYYWSWVLEKVDHYGIRGKINVGLKSSLSLK